MSLNLKTLYKDFDKHFDFFINKEKVFFKDFIKYHREAYRLYKVVPDWEMFTLTDESVNLSQVFNTGSWEVNLKDCHGWSWSSDINPFVVFNSENLIFKVVNLTDKPTNELIKELIRRNHRGT